MRRTVVVEVHLPDQDEMERHRLSGTEIVADVLEKHAEGLRSGKLGQTETGTHYIELTARTRHGSVVEAAAAWYVRWEDASGEGYENSPATAVLERDRSEMKWLQSLLQKAITSDVLKLVTERISALHTRSHRTPKQQKSSSQDFDDRRRDVQRRLHEMRKASDDGVIYGKGLHYDEKAGTRIDPGTVTYCSTPHRLEEGWLEKLVDDMEKQGAMEGFRFIGGVDVGRLGGDETAFALMQQQAHGPTIGQLLAGAVGGIGSPLGSKAKRQFVTKDEMLRRFGPPARESGQTWAPKEKPAPRRKGPWSD